MRSITKEIFLNSMVCPALGWLMRSEQPIEQLSWESLTLGERFRIEQGLEIHRRARSIYPEGRLVPYINIQAAAKETNKLITDPIIKIIYEAAFTADDYVAKADMLVRNRKGWHIVEVKSDTNDKPELVDDIGYTAMVVKRTGLHVNKVSLMLISKDYRLGMPDERLFVMIDHTAEAMERVEDFNLFWGMVKEITGVPEKPEARTRRECKKCPLFRDCVGRGIASHILEIPFLSQKKFDGLVERGIERIEDIPTDFELTPRQSTIRQCVIEGEPYVNPKLRSELDKVDWPAYYLDFETVMTAIPLYPDLAPYTQLPTQYSIHKCSDVGEVVDHREFLADSTRDCRRELAEGLIRDLEENGSIIVYSNFERTTISRLANLYPDICSGLDCLVERMVDLEAIIKSCYYHPEFHGSFSIKSTLPVLVPEMNYGDLEIADGASASASFAYLAMGKHEKVEAEMVTRNLLEYCRRDTLAMVKLHERLSDYCR